MAYAAQKTKTQYRKNQKRNAPKNQNKIPQKAKADRNRMRTELDSINQRNRNDQPFTAADVQPYVEFFDDFFALVICGSLLFTGISSPYSHSYPD